MQVHKIICRCPHCNKCCAIAAETDEGMFHEFHKFKPPKRPDSVRMLTERRCSHADCKKDFIVESYTSITILLRFLINVDTTAIGLEVFKRNTDLIEKLRNDPPFMELLLKNA